MDQINELNSRITSLKNSAYFPEESLKLGMFKTLHDSVNIVNQTQQNNGNTNQMSFANNNLSVNSSFNNNLANSLKNQ